MYRNHNQKTMLLNQRELRYRSIKYSVSSSQLLRPIQHANSNHQRLSLTKENLKTQPSHKPSPFFKQTSSHHSHLVVTRSTLNLSRKELPLQSTFKCPQNNLIEDNSHGCVLPYNKHYQELENVSQAFPAILKDSASELKNIRKELQFLSLRVEQQLVEMQQLVAVGSRGLMRQMELSLKEHNRVAVNARDRVQMTTELYQEAKNNLTEVSLKLDELQFKYNS